MFANLILTGEKEEESTSREQHLDVFTINKVS